MPNDADPLRTTARSVIKKRESIARERLDIAYKRIYEYAAKLALHGATQFSIQVIDPFMYQPLAQYLVDRGFRVHYEQGLTMTISFTPDGCPPWTLESLGEA